MKANDRSEESHATTSGNNTVESKNSGDTGVETKIGIGGYQRKDEVKPLSAHSTVTQNMIGNRSSGDDVKPFETPTRQTGRRKAQTQGTKQRKKEKMRLYMRNYYMKNRDKILASVKAYQKRRREEELQKANKDRQMCDNDGEDDDEEEEEGEDYDEDDKN